MTATRPSPSAHPATRREATAAQIVAAVRSGEVAAVDVAAAAHARIEACDAALNAVDVLRPEALDEARDVDPGLPLAGVPVLVKSEFDVAGLVTTFGGRAATRPATADSEAVRRLRAAGAVIVGTTHMPEFGQFPFTEGDSFGVTRNPWHPEHTPGGSSGGSAAAVAAGFVPVALGGDGGGSIRIPASCCGLVGLKPVRGRVSTAPHPDLWGTLGTLGPLTRTVEDAALVHDVLQGSRSVDAHAAATSLDFAAAAGRDPGRLRIGVVSRPAARGMRVDPEVRDVLARTAALLAGAGHDVRVLPERFPSVMPAYAVLFAHALAQERARVERPDLLEARTRQTARLGSLVPPRGVAAAQREGHRLARALAERTDLDVLLSPTLACLPPRVPRLLGVDAPVALWRSQPMAAFTSLANLTGLPALSYPAATSTTGLPIGVQVQALRGDEGVLMSLGHQLESLLPDRPPLAPA